MGITVQVGGGTVYDVTTALTPYAVVQGTNDTMTFYVGTAISDPTAFTYTWGASYPGGQEILTSDQSSTNPGVQVMAAFATNPLSLSGGGTFYVDSTPAGVGQAGSFSSAVAVPEPSTLVSFAAAVGILGGIGYRRRRRGLLA